MHEYLWRWKYPELKDEEFNSTIVSDNKLLSISNIEIIGKKGETIQIFEDDDSVQVEEGEYTCISFKLNKSDHIEKIINGDFTIPEDLDTEVSETEFTFILYFSYESKINDIEYQMNLTEPSTALELYSNITEDGNLIKLRKLSIFSKIKNFFKQNIDKIVEKVVSKVVSTICVTVIKYICEDYSNIVVKAVGEFACDEIGEFVGAGTRKLIFNSESKPPENYEQIVSEELRVNNFLPLSSSDVEILRNYIKEKKGTTKC